MLTRSVPSGPMFVSICNIGTSFFALSLALYSSIQLHIVVSLKSPQSPSV